MKKCIYKKTCQLFLEKLTGLKDLSYFFILEPNSSQNMINCGVTALIQHASRRPSEPLFDEPRINAQLNPLSADVGAEGKRGSHENKESELSRLFWAKLDELSVQEF